MLSHPLASVSVSRLIPVVVCHAPPAKTESPEQIFGFRFVGAEMGKKSSVVATILSQPFMSANVSL